MKYKLTNNTKQIRNITLYQIEALKDFSNVKKRDLGGWIEKESNLSQEGDCWVFGNARVYGDAEVYGDAGVYGDTLVYGNAMVYGNAEVYGDALVCDNAKVYGNAMVYGNARVYGNAVVYGDALVYGDAVVFDNARIYGNAMVYGDALVCDNAMVYGNTRVYGNAKLYGKYQYKNGWFIGGDDSGKITDITDKTGSTFWKNQYVLGDYEIILIEDEVQELTIADIEKIIGKKVKIIK